MSNSLPKDYPHREALIAGGFVTRASVRAAGDQKLNKLPNLGMAGIKEIRAYEAAHVETTHTTASPAVTEADAQRVAEEEAQRRAEEEARQKAEVEAQLKAEEERQLQEAEARRLAEEETRRKAEEEAARLRAAQEAQRRAEDEGRARAQSRPRLVRVLVESLGPNLLKKGTVTDDPEVVALLDKPYGHKLVEEVEG